MMGLEYSSYISRGIGFLTSYLNPFALTCIEMYYFSISYWMRSSGDTIGVYSLCCLITCWCV